MGMRQRIPIRRRARRSAKAREWPTLDAAEQRIARFCGTRRIPLLLTAPPLLGYAESHHAVLHGDPKVADNQGFWNATGHEVVGGLISQDLLENSTAVGGFVRSR